MPPRERSEYKFMFRKVYLSAFSSFESHNNKNMGQQPWQCLLKQWLTAASLTAGDMTVCRVVWSVVGSVNPVWLFDIKIIKAQQLHNKWKLCQ